MQFFVYGSPKERQQPKDPAELGKFMEESIKKGILVTGGGLPSQGDQGPFERGQGLDDGWTFPGDEGADTRFTVIQVETREQAIEWVTKMRQLYGDGDELVRSSSRRRRGHGCRTAHRGRDRAWLLVRAVLSGV